MFPSGIFTAVRWMWISASQHTVQHLITIPTVLQYIEKLHYQWGFTQSPWCGLKHWSQWKKMVCLSVPHHATHAAFLSFFNVPQAAARSLILFVFLSLVYYSPPQLHRSLETFLTCNRSQKSSSFFMLRENTLNSAHGYTHLWCQLR